MNKLNEKLTYLFYGLLFATSIYDFLFRDGEKILRILLIGGTLIGLQLFYKKSFLRKSSIIYNVILFFIFISMYLANVWNFYGIEHYDKFLHLLSGGILGFIGLAFYMYMFNVSSRRDIDTKKVIVFLIMFLVSIAGIWEIWEFTTDSLFGLMAQNGLEDTMWDMILGTIGGLFILIPIIRYAKGQKVKIIEEFLRDVRK